MSHKILTVDDSKMVRMIVTKAFAPYDCEIHEASSGAEALVKALEFAPDLIFLDITMPDMNGLAVLEQIRGADSLKNTPVIMLTAESGNNSIARADQLTVSGSVSKPFKAEKLLEVAGAILQLQPAAA